MAHAAMRTRIEIATRIGRPLQNVVTERVTGSGGQWCSLDIRSANCATEFQRRWLTTSCLWNPAVWGTGDSRTEEVFVPRVISDGIQESERDDDAEAKRRAERR